MSRTIKYLLPISILCIGSTIFCFAQQVEKKPDVDFSSIDNMDLDADEINDMDDQCPGTPKSVKVDKKGCPLDTDGDGIPDYLDKEAGTKKGALVDVDGKTVTDAMILEKSKRDSLTYIRTSTFTNAPSASTLKKIDNDIKNKPLSGNNSKIPSQFTGADTNKNGIISSGEISGVIEGFFDGSNDYTAAKIHTLIDYFFEQ